jgi:hypothetical protein
LAARRSSAAKFTGAKKSGISPPATHTKGMRGGGLAAARKKRSSETCNCDGTCS